MSERIPQSVAYLEVFRAFLASDGKTPATGKTIAITISKNGGAFGNPAAGATNATEISSGFYKFTLATGDTDTLGPLAWRGAEGTINDAGDKLTVAKATNAGFSALPDAAAEASGGLPTLSAAQASNGTINANVHRWLTGTPNALSSGRVEVLVGAVTAGVIAAASFAAGALDAVWSTATRVLTAATNLTTALATPTNITAGTITTVTTLTNAPPDSSGVTTLLGKFTGITLLAQWLGLIAGKQTGNATARTELRATGAGSGTYDETTDSQEALRDNMGTAQTGDTFARLGAPAGASVSADVAAVKVDTAAILDDTGTSGVVVAAASKTGYALSTAGVQAIWDALTSVLTTVGSIGKLLVDNVNATISSRATPAQVNTEADTALADVGLTTTITGRIDAAVSTRATPAQVNTEVDTALTDIHLDHLLAADYDPASKPGVATALLNELIESDAGVSRYTANALEQAPTGGSAPTAADVADAVWDELISGHLGAGSTGAALNAAGSAGDPWTTPLPGAYGAGTAGKIIGDNVNATISSRASQTSVDDIPTNAELATSQAAADDATLAAIAALNNLSIANVRTAVGLASANLDTQLADLPTNAELATALGTSDDATLAQIALVKAKTDLIPASPAAVGSAMTLTSGERTSVADALLTRDMSAVTGEAARSPLNAMRFNRNRFTIVGSTLTVYEEDDTTIAWTASITTAAGDPVSASDPA